jgi:hypothetical protein
MDNSYSEAPWQTVIRKNRKRNNNIITDSSIEAKKPSLDLNHSQNIPPISDKKQQHPDKSNISIKSETKLSFSEISRILHEFFPISFKNGSKFLLLIVC